MSASELLPSPLRIARSALGAFGTAAAFVACAGLVTCARAPDTVDPPDVSRLLSAYADPRGTVDATGPSSWLGGAAVQVKLLGGGKANVLITAIVAAAFERVDAAALPTGHGGILPTRVDGTVTLAMPCGSGPDEIAEVSVALVDGVVSPLLWGTSHACPLWQSRGVRVRYDGTFTMYRYPGDDLLVRVDGTISGAGSPIVLDFRVINGHVETRVATSTGDVIVMPDGSAVVARAANGTFHCDPTRLTCAVR